MKTYSLDEAAALICGADADGNPLPGKTKWLALRLRRGLIPGYKAGHKWRMTQEDVEAAIESLRPQRVVIPQVPQLSGLTRTSARRLSA